MRVPVRACRMPRRESDAAPRLGSRTPRPARTHAHSYARTRPRPRTRTRTRTQTRTRTRTHTRTYTHTRTHATHTHTHAHPLTHSRTHPHAPARKHPHARTHYYTNRPPTHTHLDQVAGEAGGEGKKQRRGVETGEADYYKYLSILQSYMYSKI